MRLLSLSTDQPEHLVFFSAFVVIYYVISTRFGASFITVFALSVPHDIRNDWYSVHIQGKGGYIASQSPAWLTGTRKVGLPGVTALLRIPYT